MDCDGFYHLPCAISSGCALEFGSRRILCLQHRNKNEIVQKLFDDCCNCVQCQSSDNQSEMLMCFECAKHYHLKCYREFIQSDSDQLLIPLTRNEWRCIECKQCYKCKQPGDMTRTILCHGCDKCFHIYCLKEKEAPISESQTPSEWRCPFCSLKFGQSQCTQCKKGIHLYLIESESGSICDECQFMNLIQQKQQSMVPQSQSQSLTILNKRGSSSSVKDLGGIPSQFGQIQSQNLKKQKQIRKQNPKTKRSNSGSLNPPQREKRSSESSSNSNSSKKGLKDDEDNEGGGLDDGDDEPTIGHIKRDEDDHHAVTLILLNTKQSQNSLQRDICLHCGSFGQNGNSKEEGGNDLMLSCSQCGQSFHWYCAGIQRICDVMMTRGWRCLDCTVCEGCGKATDESRLLLCDDCDISYHIYCLDPPLIDVPQGNWKCSFCVKCIKCESKEPNGGIQLNEKKRKVNYEWKNNSTECELCYSLTQCHQCQLKYKQDDLILKCIHCQRWSHINCKNQELNDDEIEQCINNGDSGFSCSFCQQESVLIIQQKQTEALLIRSLRGLPNLMKSKEEEIQLASDLKHFVEELSYLTKSGVLDEGTFLTDSGLDFIKKLKIKPAPAFRRNKKPQLQLGSINQQKGDHDQDEGSRSPTNVLESSGEPQKRIFNFGLGGFNPKGRNRNRTPNPNESQMNPIQIQNQNKRKKQKSIVEEMIPVYMQEPFFGTKIIINEEGGGGGPSIINSKEQITPHLDSTADLDNLPDLDLEKSKGIIKLDESNLKLFQQQKSINNKCHELESPSIGSNNSFNNQPQSHSNSNNNLELGIEDFLDSDIVSYLISENRILMDIPVSDHHNQPNSSSMGSMGSMNLQKPKKYFEDKLYQDIFHQITEEQSMNNQQNQKEKEIQNKKEEEIQIQINPIEDLARQLRKDALNQNKQNQQQNQDFLNLNQNSLFRNEVQGGVGSREGGVSTNKDNSDYLMSVVAELDGIDDEEEEEEGEGDGGDETSQDTIYLKSKGDPEINKKKQLIQKYFEDEELGELSTQAMSLFSNLTQPHLKNEIPNLNERYKNIQKIWRKLDSQTKLIYVNKSRANRYKKKKKEEINSKKKIKSPINEDQNQNQNQNQGPIGLNQQQFVNVINPSQSQQIKIINQNQPQIVYQIHQSHQIGLNHQSQSIRVNLDQSQQLINSNQYQNNESQSGVGSQSHPQYQRQQTQFYQINSNQQPQFKSQQIGINSQGQTLFITSNPNIINYPLPPSSQSQNQHFQNHPLPLPPSQLIQQNPPPLPQLIQQNQINQQNLIQINQQNSNYESQLIQCHQYQGQNQPQQHQIVSHHQIPSHQLGLGSESNQINQIQSQYQNNPKITTTQFQPLDEVISGHIDSVIDSVVNGSGEITFDKEIEEEEGLEELEGGDEEEEEEEETESDSDSENEEENKESKTNPIVNLLISQQEPPSNGMGQNLIPKSISLINSNPNSVQNQIINKEMIGICKDDHLKILLKGNGLKNDETSTSNSSQSTTNNNNIRFLQLDGQLDSDSDQGSQFQFKNQKSQVVINHELLASYGVSINPNQSQPSSSSSSSSSSSQSESINLKSNSIKNIMQMQQQKMNGDNTLLKALLQTAPKNAPPLNSSQSNSQGSNSNGIHQNGSNEKEEDSENSKIKNSISKTESTSSSIAESIMAVAYSMEEEIQGPLKDKNEEMKPIEKKKRAPRKRKTNSEIQFNKKTEESENEEEEEEGLELEGGNEMNLIQILLNNLKKNKKLEMQQPQNDLKQNVNKIMASFQHWFKLKQMELKIDESKSTMEYLKFKKKENFNFKSKYQFSVLNILNEIQEIDQNKSEESDKSGSCQFTGVQNKKGNQNHHRIHQIYKICSAFSSSSSSHSINSLNSVERINSIFQNKLKPEFYENSEEKENSNLIKKEPHHHNHHLEEYLLKSEEKDNYPNSPIIHLINPHQNQNINLNEEGIERDQSPNKNQISSRLQLGLNKSAAKNIRKTLGQFFELTSNILQSQQLKVDFVLPKQWDIGKCLKIEREDFESESENKQRGLPSTAISSEFFLNLIEINNKFKKESNGISFYQQQQNNSISIPETLNSIETLISFKCQFCESFLFISKIQNEKLFCSEFCQKSFEKCFQFEMKLKKKLENGEIIKDQIISNNENNSEIENTVVMDPIISILNQQGSTSQIQKRKSNEGPSSSLLKSKSSSIVLKWSPQLNNKSHLLIDKEIKGIPNPIESINKFHCLDLNSIEGEDQRPCLFCPLIGDQPSESSSRLLHFDIDKWVHLNCALWSDEVYETMNGSLMNVDLAFRRSLSVLCSQCSKPGASLKCFAPKCPNPNFHFSCARDSGCYFYEDKTLLCFQHYQMHLASDQLKEHLIQDLRVQRSVWIHRGDECQQIQQFLNEMEEQEKDLGSGSGSVGCLRIGTLIIHQIGQLLPQQLHCGHFHNRQNIYPIGYSATRIYWSKNDPFQRCLYKCEIDESEGRPLFKIKTKEKGFPSESIQDPCIQNIWKNILNKIEEMRKAKGLVKIFPQYFTGEYLFGLKEPHVMRLCESLPGIETLCGDTYTFKFGRIQLLTMPLTLNPSGCARSEPKLRTHFRKPSQQLKCVVKTTTNHHKLDSLNEDQNDLDLNDLENGGGSSNGEQSSNEEPKTKAESIPSYLKQFTLSKSYQIKKLKTDWRGNVYLAKSKIQGLGLFAARDLEKNTMIVEYIGECIRNEVANRREKLYQEQNKGIYMFRLNDDFVIDATISGGLARYVNHCCDPNCIAETILEKDFAKIIIIANKKVNKGEELTYDYKFDFEDESNKISCLCGANNCKKWMN